MNYKQIKTILIILLLNFLICLVTTGENLNKEIEIGRVLTRQTLSNNGKNYGLPQPFGLRNDKISSNDVIVKL